MRELVGGFDVTASHLSRRSRCHFFVFNKFSPPSCSVQLNTGQCLNMMVNGGATVAQLRGYIDSAAGFSVAGPSTRLIYRRGIKDDGERSETNQSIHWYALVGTSKPREVFIVLVLPRRTTLEVLASLA